MLHSDIKHTYQTSQNMNDWLSSRNDLDRKIKIKRKFMIDISKHDHSWTIIKLKLLFLESCQVHNNIVNSKPSQLCQQIIPFPIHLSFMLIKVHTQAINHIKKVLKRNFICLKRVSLSTNEDYAWLKNYRSFKGGNVRLR